MSKKQKTTGTEIVKWEEEFANLARENAKNVKASEGKFISFKSGRMAFNGSEVPDNKLQCVVVGWAHHNAYYDPSIRYDPKNPQTPICYATHVLEDEMTPHEKSPNKQSSSCAACPLNVFGSADTGIGKACKNGIRLALIASSDLEDLDAAEVVYANLPPKSIKNWLKYVKELSDKVQRPHWAVVTEMQCVPDSQSQFQVTFKTDELIEDSSLFGPLKKMWQTAIEGIDFPYPRREAAAPTSKAVKNKFSKRS